MARSTHQPGQPFGRGLVVQSGSEAGTLVSLRAPVTLIGSGASCDVCLTAEGVQPLHCILTPADEVISLRAVGDCAVRVNGRAETATELKDGDTIEIGIAQFRVQWHSDALSTEATLDSLRIQAAAVVAQQTALNELEISLVDRETALAGQESQLATRLEHQRKQLLHLQSQIAKSRADLRERRHAFSATVAEQESQLESTRRDVEQSQVELSKREKRMARLWSKLKARISQERAEARRQQQKLIGDAKRAGKNLATKYQAWKQERIAFHTQAELEKRQLAEGWCDLHQSQSSMNERIVRLARKEKDFAGTERKLTVTVNELQGRRDSLRKEIETLEARANNARNALARIHSLEDIALPAPTVPFEPISEPAHELRIVADEITDGQTLLADQVGRFAIVRMGWEEERAHLVAELERVAAELASKETRLAVDEGHWAAISQQRAAEQIKEDAEAANRRAELERFAAVLMSKSREVESRQTQLSELYRLWGRRRTETLTGLRAALITNVAAREEWAALHDRLLRIHARLIVDQQELSARQLAVEQYRRDVIDAADQPEVAAKRVERLQRQWVKRCKASSRDLKRLGSSLKSESERLDRRFAELQNEETKLQNRVADLDDLFAVAEIQQVNTAAERAHRLEQADAESKQRASYEQQLAGLRDQLDRLAAVFIEVPSVPGSRAA